MHRPSGCSPHVRAARIFMHSMTRTQLFPDMASPLGSDELLRQACERKQQQRLDHLQRHRCLIDCKKWRRGLVPCQMFTCSPEKEGSKSYQDFTLTPRLQPHREPSPAELKNEAASHDLNGTEGVSSFPLGSLSDTQ